MIIRGTDRVLVMGITGKQGTFWTERMQAYGTQVVGGTNPNKAGTLHCDVPVFATAGDAAVAHPEVARLVREMHAAGKPMGFICIAPAIAASPMT